MELEEREAVPGVHGLDVQRGVHVGSVQRQKGLGVFGHQLGPPREGLRESRRHVREQEVALASTTYPETDIYMFVFRQVAAFLLSPSPSVLADGPS